MIYDVIIIFHVINMPPDAEICGVCITKKLSVERCPMWGKWYSQFVRPNRWTVVQNVQGWIVVTLRESGISVFFSGLTAKIMYIKLFMMMSKHRCHSLIKIPSPSGNRTNVDFKTAFLKLRDYEAVHRYSI